MIRKILLSENTYFVIGLLAMLVLAFSVFFFVNKDDNIESRLYFIEKQLGQITRKIYLENQYE